jgi:hypothetical protein
MSDSRVSGFVRRTRSEADRLVAEFEQSGLTRTAFCRAQGISAHTLDYYRRMRRGKPAGSGKLLPVELIGAPGVGLSASAQLRLELGKGRVIVVEEGYGVSLLKSVVAALEA